MGVDEPARHELYVQLVEWLGPDHARTLMAHLPPAGWSDLATKQDLDSLKHQLLAMIRGEINAQTRLLFFSMIGALFTAVSLGFAAARIA